MKMIKNSTNFKNEKELQARTNKYFRNKWFFIYKISDSWLWYKPYDIIMRSEKWDYHIEQKVMNSTRCDVYKALRPHQRWNLWLIEKLWWNAIVMVFYKKEKSILIYRYNDLKTWIDFSDFSR